MKCGEGASAGEGVGNGILAIGGLSGDTFLRLPCVDPTGDASPNVAWILAGLGREAGFGTGPMLYFELLQDSLGLADRDAGSVILLESAPGRPPFWQS